MKPTRASNRMIGAGPAAFVALGASGQGRVASEEEARQAAEERRRTMKPLGRAMHTLKSLAGGRGTAEEASAAAAAIADAAPALPPLFPAGSGMAALPDSEWNLPALPHRGWCFQNGWTVGRVLKGRI